MTKDDQEDFRRFLLTIIAGNPSLYVDQETHEFLTSGKIRELGDPRELELHEQQFWEQIMGLVRMQCPQCKKVFWVDGDKISEGDTQTACTACKQPISVQKPVTSA